MSSFLITGGTGTLGKALAKELVQDHVVRILSRDEFKQSEMRKELNHPNMRYFIGDVRDKDRLVEAMRGVDVVVHAAAMKQVPACEYDPYEAVKTNIVGTHNVIEACEINGVKKALFISTDKAVDPINLYGATKLVAEKLWLNSNRGKTKFSLTRWGNVLGSRGSVIDLWKNQNPLEITHPDMTRFWIRVQDVVQFVLDKLNEMQGGEVFIPDIKSSRIEDLADLVAPGVPHKYVGIRQGEKIHESLGEFSSDEKLMTPEELRNLYESI